MGTLLCRTGPSPGAGIFLPPPTPHTLTLTTTHLTYPQRHQVFEGHAHYVMMVKFNPKDTGVFASASLDRTIKVRFLFLFLFLGGLLQDMARLV